LILKANLFLINLICIDDPQVISLCFAPNMLYFNS